MPFPRPPELLALVIEFVHREDHNTINSCALVSRTWCLHSRPHIFRHIEITVSKPSTEGWLERLTERDLIPLIHGVTLRGKKSSICKDMWQDHSAIADWKIDSAEELGGRLTHVESLNVICFMGDLYRSSMSDLEPHFAFLKHLGSAKGGLRRLTLNQVCFARPDQLFRYLSNVPGQPTELSLKDIHFIENQEEDLEYSNVASVPPSSRWQLTSLNLGHHELRKDVISWLLSPIIDITRLQSLEIAGPHRGQGLPLPPATMQLVVAIGQTVKKLTFDISRFASSNPFNAEAIKRLTALEQLFVVSEKGLHGNYVLSGMRSILPGLDGNTSLTEIILTVEEVKCADEWKNFDLQDSWDALDRELDGARLPGFRRLLILATEDDSIEDIENLVREQMPRLSSRGLLGVRAEMSSMESW